MRVDNSDFSILVGRLERESDDDPRIYAIKVALVAALGYALICLVAVAILVACYFVIHSLVSEGRVYGSAILGCVTGIATLVAVARALRVRIDAPEGRRITREEAPALFAAIDDVIQRMATRKNGRITTVTLDAVTLDREFNAGICQIPRWGVFGNYSNHLQLGVPLMAAVSVAEFKAVLAHEIGHLGGEHGRFAAWIYRQRMTWRVLQRKLEEPANFFDQILAAFYGWYAPYFYAYTFVLARQHEYAADLAAAQATNAGVLARALTKVELAGRFLAEIFWKRLFDQIEKVPEPQYLPYSMMPRAFAVAQKEWLRRDWLQSSLQRFAADDDTHPGLGERLAALGVQPEVPTYTPDKSALSLFGADATAMLKGCDDEWQRENAPAWRKRHDAIKEIRWKIAEYDNTPAAELKPENLWERAMLLLDLGEEGAVIEALHSLVAREPSMAKAHLLLGRLLLQYGDEHGLQNLALAARHDVELAVTAGELGYGYLTQRGRKGEAQRFWERTRAA
jgi:hypothetical protein